MTDALQDWDDSPNRTRTAPEASASSLVHSTIASLDLTAGIERAVQAAVRKRLDQVAAAALETVFDKDTLTQLQGAANTAVRAVLDAPPVTAEEPATELYFPTVLAFVTQHLAPTYRRSLSANSATWCPEWWKHAEAIARLEALWRAWEHLRLDPATGISVWFRDHADHHMAILLSADGPFKGCSPDKGHSQRLDPLPLTAPPNGMFHST